jgi:Regulator of Chromosome Condensation (RCC1) repeat protein/PASTA domain-containing protein
VLPIRFLALAALSVGLLLQPAAGQARALAAGTVVAWGCQGEFADVGQCTVPSGLSGVTAIAAGWSFNLALKGDGTVVAWGCGANADFGQCSVPSGLSGVKAIAAGEAHSLALRSDGTVVAWGCGAGSDFGQCSVPSGLSGVTAIAAGSVHSLAVKSDGTVVAWGCGINNFGQCSVPGGLSGVTAVAAGYVHSVALKSDGTIVGWGGCGFFGQCPQEGFPGVSAISAGYAHTLVVVAYGQVGAWGCGGFDHGQCSVNGFTDVTAVSAGVHHSLLLKGDGTVVALGCHILNGFGDFGQCNVPAGLSDVTAVGAGLTHSLALIGPKKQTITFEPLPDKTYGDPDFAVSATASSGLPVSFAAAGNCTVIGATVHLTGPGACTITASQGGNADYRPAPDVERTFSIAPTPCTVPKVTGKRLPAAKSALARSHCRTGNIRRVYSRKKKKGIVLSQSRRPGVVLPPASKVDLVASKGRRPKKAL